MSYVGEPFKWDIFVSYGRAGRQGIAESPMRTWSTAFAGELGRELLGPKRFSGTDDRTLKVFFDESALPGLVFPTEPIRAAAASSAILLILNSEDYLASQWCRVELEDWDAGQQKEEIPGEDRIALVHLEPTNQKLWSARLKDSQGEGPVGYWFHTPVKGSQASLPFGHPIPSYKEPGDFQTAFRRLLKDLWGRLDALKEELDVRHEARRRLQRLNAPQCYLYLHGRSGQNSDWDHFAEQLRNKGFVVLPTSLDPIHKSPGEESAFYQERLATMTDCDALLVMSTESDSAFDAGLSYITRRARRSLQARGIPPHPCALLNSVAQQARTANRKALADQLRLTWIETTQTPWAPDVDSWLAELSRENEAP